NNKLNYKKLKPFEIIKKVLLINFKFKFLNTIRYYLVFYILFLKPVFKSLYIKNRIIIELNKLKYEIERIINYRTKKKYKKYFIK
ncbi:hypothetical protein CORC01_10883, partial [Colletotrichum orchidophilum]